MSQLQSNEATQTPTASEVRSMVERTGPTGIVVGAGGDPLIIGLPIFAVGSLALGMALIGFVPATALGAVVPIVVFGTGLFLTVVTIWAALLAQTMVAGITGTFAGFWLSLGALLVGLGHNWYGVAAADVSATQQLFFIAWGALFLFLLIPTLRLPAIYPAVVGLVVVALALAATGARTGDVNILKAAGYVILVFSLLGFCAFVNVALTAMGAKRPFPPLGPALVS
ncbi:GPR1/FUN34/YaaH family transporter [Amycolatopsis sp. GM8]|uniref:GPR1/FUN34/YaaH family transporter n=1 Tax=Amycolatopsis sp. GM8 TaxID=2896530 RepID=UPI001F1C0B35|nr:GPR1/FUN34/YaaH family transporter [Amycolatopsis sp. GM8]